MRRASIRRARERAARTGVPAVAASLALVLAVSACGSSTHVPAARTPFTQACGYCHSLTGHDTPAKQGGDLLDVHLPRAVALQFAREMPVPHPLSRSQLAAIVDYIEAVQRGRAR